MELLGFAFSQADVVVAEAEHAGVAHGGAARHGNGSAGGEAEVVEASADGIGGFFRDRSDDGTVSGCEVGE